MYILYEPTLKPDWPPASIYRFAFNNPIINANFCIVHILSLFCASLTENCIYYVSVMSARSGEGASGSLNSWMMLIQSIFGGTWYGWYGICNPM